jgi:hypothetical protein
MWGGGGRSADDPADYGGAPLGARYRLVERLGAGGMSVVWRGYDEILGRQVAVKVLATRLASDRSFRHRIRLEAQAAARLCHPNITNVYDYGEAVEGGLTVPYVVMELVEGQSLAARLGRDRRLPWREAVITCAEVAGALAAAHARGVVHRDVTPSNVMLTPAGAKVVDFGISALAGEREASPDGHLFGTPAYLAPERLDGGQVSPATDVYALGLLLYRTLTGRLPWQASTTTQMLTAHRYYDPAPMPPVEGLPDEVAQVCRRCLDKAPEQRPSSAELARILADAAGIAPALPIVPASGTASLDDAAELANAGTTILPWSSRTGVLPLPGSAPVRHPPGWRSPIGAAAIGVGVVLVAGLIWAGTSRSRSGDDPGTTPAQAATAGDPHPCRVEYALRMDSGASFDAQVTVANTGAQPIRDWALTFAFPGDQTIGAGGAAQWAQQGRDVVGRPPADQGELAPGASTVLGLTGSYAGSNPLPVEFRLAGSTCDVQVSGAAAKPDDSAPAQSTEVTPVLPAGPAGAPPAAGSNAGPGGGPPPGAKPDDPGHGKENKGPKKPKDD